MNFTPLLTAGAAVHIHLAATILALLLGGILLARRKGTISHRTLGWIWVLLMLAAAVSSFWITGSDGAYGTIHILSAVILVVVPAAVLAIRRGRVKTHRHAMISIYLTGLIIPGLFTLWPTRLLGRLLGDGLSLLTLAQ
jgi:uncharacterized membrane protein